MPSASPPWESAREATYIESGRGGHISQLSRPLLRGATRVAVFAPGPMTVRAVPAQTLVDQLAEPLATLGTAKRPRHPLRALVVPRVVLDGATPRPGGVPRICCEPARGHLAGPLALVPPCSRRDSRQAPNLGDDVGMAVVELSEGPCREPPPLDAVHGGLPPGPVSVQDSHRSPMSPGKGSGEPGIPSPHFAAIVTR